MKEQIVEINGRTVITNGQFAFDGCHKIYIIEDEDDLKSAKEHGYNLYPIEELEETYNTSCPLRFICNWKLNDHYVRQGTEEVIFNYV